MIIEMSTCNPPWNAEAVSNHLALMYKVFSHGFSHEVLLFIDKAILKLSAI